MSLLLVILFVLVLNSISEDTYFALLHTVKSNPSIDNIYKLGNYYLYYHNSCSKDVAYHDINLNTLYDTFITRLQSWDNKYDSIECKSRTLLCYSVVLHMKRTVIQDKIDDTISPFDYPGMLNDLGILYSSIDMYHYAIDAYEEALSCKYFNSF